MKLTLKERYAIALYARGEKIIKRNFNFDVWSRSNPSQYFYYLGRAGALRVGTTQSTSRPCSAEFKAMLLRPPVEG